MGCLFAAAFVSITAVLCLDYFFTLTLFPLGVNQTMSVVALIACLTTTLVIARLKFKMRKSFQKVQALKDQLRLVIDTLSALVCRAVNDDSDNLNQRWLDYRGRSLGRDWPGAC